MHPIFYYIFFYLIVSAGGMYIANRKVSKTVKRQRWLKFFTYILITGIVVASILFEKFFVVADIILITATFELIRANFYAVEKEIYRFVFVFVVFIIIALGFFYFSKTFNPSVQLFIYFQVFTFDAFCQITGQIFGRHALLPKISPSKTVEGLVGGVIFCIASAMLARNWINISVYTSIFIGSIVSFTAFCGDMLASYFKRTVKIKNYSNFLPGQGGFLDRFDSLIMTGAVSYFFLHFVFKDNLFLRYS
jgi:phosphatidate cytidylyltransferase